ncbi:RNA methyltransferase [Azonexus sp.]|uniref:RNA methyltransferase n=1 Tax=Azonexus sp. TaxID=1872668 RepID=UPI0039E6C3CC
MNFSTDPSNISANINADACVPATLGALERRLAALGAAPAHRARLLRAWLHGQPLDHGPRKQAAENFLPLSLRTALPALEEALKALAQPVSEHPGSDGTRLLLRLYDGQTVESVLLPRAGVCISTQLGCAVGCSFCMTGRSGLLRQLSTPEMLAQVVLARHYQRLRRVVFMGMGEPAHNLDNVLETIQLLGSLGGFGHKDLVFSSVGDPRIFEALAQGPVKPALALSLHTTDAALRAELLPRAPRLSPRELVDAGEEYARRTTYPIQLQWTLLAGINDSFAEMDAAADLLRGKYAILNLIPYNPTAALAYQRPSAEHIAQLVQHLRQRGIRVAVRQSAGQEVEGGCGQLRARTLATPPAPISRFR